MLLVGKGLDPVETDIRPQAATEGAGTSAWCNPRYPRPYGLAILQQSAPPASPQEEKNRNESVEAKLKDTEVRMSREPPPPRRRCPFYWRTAASSKQRAVPVQFLDVLFQTIPAWARDRRYDRTDWLSAAIQARSRVNALACRTCTSSPVASVLLASEPKERPGITLQHNVTLFRSHARG